MAYLQDVKKTELNSSYSVKPINLEGPRVTKNYIIGKSKYCNIIIPDGYKYTATYHAIVSSISNFVDGIKEFYLGDLKTKGRTVVQRDFDDEFRVLKPVQCHEEQIKDEEEKNCEKIRLEPATSADRIYKLKNNDKLTFGSEEYDKYKIRFLNEKFLNSQLEDVVNEDILTYVIGKSDLASITVPDRIRNFEVKNVDLFHSAIIGYKNNGERKWGVIDLGTKGKTHIRRNGLVEDIKSSENLEFDDEVKIGNKFADYNYTIFKLQHGDEILLNGVEEEDLRGAYVFKFLEKLETK